ncbi:MAG: dihydrofolate reductase family protein [Candidatus Methanoperedens sp.]|nr:dihydrofolate reductase family protein [Candidatus Methanoperedens sp.]
MRKIIVSEFYSLDGLMSDPEDKMEWITGTFNEEMGKYEGGLYDSADTLLLGRTTYKIFEGYWPTAASNPATSQGDIEMAHKMNNITKIVFSHSMEGVEWKNSKLLKEINPEEIVKLKKEKGKNILVIGSASIVQQLTNLGLIDEYHLLVHPVVLGSGKPLFKNIKDRLSLKLVNAETFKNGVVLLLYQPETKGGNK